MQAAALLVLAGTEAPSDLGRVVNALQIARELDESGDEVTVIFDGAGTQWVPLLEDEDHKYHTLFAKTRSVIAGACSYCAGAYGVKEDIETQISDHGSDPADRDGQVNGQRELAGAGAQHPERRPKSCALPAACGLHRLGGGVPVRARRPR